MKASDKTPSPIITTRRPTHENTIQKPMTPLSQPQSPKATSTVPPLASLNHLPNELLFNVIQTIRRYLPTDARSPAFELAHVNRRLRAFALPHAFEKIKVSDVSRFTPLWTYFSRRPFYAALVKSLQIQVGYYDASEASLEQQDIVATYPVSEFEHLGREICSRVHDIRLSKLHGILRNTINLKYLSLSGISLDYAMILVLRDLPLLVSLSVDHIEDYCLASDDQEDNNDRTGEVTGVRSFHPKPLPASCFPSLTQLSIKHHPRRYDLTNKDVTCYHPIHALLHQCHLTLRHLRVVYSANKDADSDETDFGVGAMLNCNFPDGFFNLHSLTLEDFTIDFTWLSRFVESQPDLKNVDLRPSSRFTVKEAKRLPGFFKATDKKSLVSLSYVLDYIPQVEERAQDGMKGTAAEPDAGNQSDSSEDESSEDGEGDLRPQVIELAVELSVEITAGFLSRLARWFPHLQKLTLTSTLGTIEPFDVFIDELAEFKCLTHLSLPWIPDDWVRTTDPRIFLMSRVTNPPSNNATVSSWFCFDCSLGICATVHEARLGTEHRSPLEEWRSDSEGAVSTAVTMLAKRTEKLERFDWYPLTPSAGERSMVWRWDITRRRMSHDVDGASGSGAPGSSLANNWPFPNWRPTNEPTSHAPMTEVESVSGDFLYTDREDIPENTVPIYQCRVQEAVPARWS